MIVDDDEEIRELVNAFLRQHGFDADAVANVGEMRAALAENPYDLIVLDVMMPGEDGLSALRSLRDGPPVIMLSAIGGDIDRIVGLEMGAQDYLAKPCNPRELLARIRTVLRRHEGLQSPDVQGSGLSASEALTFEGWRLELLGRTLRDPDGVIVNLTDGEFRLLRAFVERPQRVLSRDQLLDSARGADTESYDRAVDVQLSRLRRKLRVNGADSELIRTIRNEGYMFTPRVRRV
ncbi:two-component system OmpR family response regulator [Parvularcula dongshanensis]|uniref:Regulatory protein VirG n=1 Tax=Parvularcula dongshanensis TaxID=1173995 RepID=A0A840I808_9PROT|nr:response regulator [Parvularcula dongshanensis]MBB4660411.1 two-component system OmpR family response regulator [Parvularcula dongshanensis]